MAPSKQSVSTISLIFKAVHNPPTHTLIKSFCPLPLADPLPEPCWSSHSLRKIHVIFKIHVIAPAGNMSPTT